MILNSKNSTIILSDETGSVLSYKVYEQEMCTPGGEARSLFTIKLLDEVGFDEQLILNNDLQKTKLFLLNQC